MHMQGGAFLTTPEVATKGPEAAGAPCYKDSLQTTGTRQPLQGFLQSVSPGFIPSPLFTQVKEKRESSEG